MIYNNRFRKKRFDLYVFFLKQQPKQFAAVTAGIVGATGLAYMYADSELSANMADEGLHPPHHPWAHSGPLSTYDHAAYVIHIHNNDTKTIANNT